MEFLKYSTVLTLSIACLFTACTQFDRPEIAEHDELAGLTRGEFEEALNRKQAAPLPSSLRRPITEKATHLTTAAARIDPGPLVTLSVNETVPLKDVLLSLARQAEREIEIDPRIEGGIILSVQNRPFLKVVERIANLGGLRFNVEDSILRVELDEPFHKSYKINFLDVERQFSSTVNTSVNVFTSSEGGNGSTNSLETTASNTLWKDIEATLEQLLSSHAPVRLVKQNTNRTALVQNEIGNSESINLGTEGVVDTIANSSDTIAQIADASSNTAPGSSDDESDPSKRHFFTVNRTAGLVNVHATERQHRAITEYIDRLERSLTSQVLIEAKILEVNLNKEFHAGINWRAVLGKLSAAAPLGGSVAPSPGPFDSLFGATSNAFSIALDTDDLEGVLTLVESFGTTRTLSSPRVTVLQGHTAVLKVAENQVFFQLTFEREEQEDGDDIVTVSSEINTVPVGVVITVQPSIDLDSQSVSMTLRPTITRISDTVNDPAVSIASNNTVQSVVPVVAVQEIDSVVKMDSGDTIVMGGLMRDDIRRDDQGIPVASEIPLFGNLFKARDEVTEQSELVIFLRATIVDNHIEDKDIGLYRQFARDPRPFIPLQESDGL